MPILKYDANHDALVEQKEGIAEEEEEPKTPSQSTFEEGEDLENEDEKTFRSCNWITMDSWPREEGGLPSYVWDHKNTHKWGLLTRL